MSKYHSFYHNMYIPDEKLVIFLAAANNNVDVIQEGLDKGNFIDHSNCMGTTALIYACERAHMESIKLLLDNKANINHQDNNGKTALMEVAQHSGTCCQYLLMSYNPDVNITDKDGNTALLHAAKRGGNIMILLALQAGANINHVNNNGQTALILSAVRGYYDAVKILVECNADIQHVDNQGLTALIYACINRHFDVVKLLLRFGSSMSLNTIINKVDACQHHNVPMYERVHVGRRDLYTYKLTSEMIDFLRVHLLNEWTPNTHYQLSRQFTCKWDIPITSVTLSEIIFTLFLIRQTIDIDQNYLAFLPRELMYNIIIHIFP